MFESTAVYADALAGSRQSRVVYHESPPRMQRNGSVITINTRQLSFSQGLGDVSIERRNERSDDEIIMVTVRLSKNERRASYDEALPSRPKARGFLRRMSTRILPPAEEFNYTAVKMLRADYKRYFVRDNDGNYAGSEPERQWDAESIKQQFGAYQDLPVGVSLV